MKPYILATGIVVFFCGLAASYMTSRLLAERNKEPAGEAKVSVLVAMQKVSPWVPIKDPEKYFIVKEVPENIAPKNAIKSFEAIWHQRLNKVLAEGSFVTQDDLLNKDQQTLAASMRPGMRAYALKVNAESLTDACFLPGSRVDVIWTRRGDKEESNSRTILQNMLVLAVDPKADPNPDDERANLGCIVTIAATPEEVRVLSLESRRANCG